jgi:hypothetical protein
MPTVAANPCGLLRLNLRTVLKALAVLVVLAELLYVVLNSGPRAVRARIDG